MADGAAMSLLSGAPAVKLAKVLVVGGEKEPGFGSNEPLRTISNHKNVYNQSLSCCFFEVV